MILTHTHLEKHILTSPRLEYIAEFMACHSSPARGFLLFAVYKVVVFINGVFNSMKRDSCRGRFP